MIKKTYLTYYPQNRFSTTQIKKELHDKEFHRRLDTEKFNRARNPVYYEEVQKNLADYSQYRTFLNGQTSKLNLNLGWATKKRVDITVWFQNFVEFYGIQAYVPIMKRRYRVAHPFATDFEIAEYIAHDTLKFMRTLESNLSVLYGTLEKHGSNKKLIRQDFCQVSFPYAANKIIPVSKKSVLITVGFTLYTTGAIASDMYGNNEKMDFQTFKEYAIDYKTYSIYSYGRGVKRFVCNIFMISQSDLIPKQPNLVQERVITPSENMTERVVLKTKDNFSPNHLSEAEKSLDQSLINAKDKIMVKTKKKDF